MRRRDRRRPAGRAALLPGTGVLQRAALGQGLLTLGQLRLAGRDQVGFMMLAAALQLLQLLLCLGKRRLLRPRRDKALQLLLQRLVIESTRGPPGPERRCGQRRSGAGPSESGRRSPPVGCRWAHRSPYHKRGRPRTALSVCCCVRWLLPGPATQGRCARP